MNFKKFVFFLVFFVFFLIPAKGVFGEIIIDPKNIAQIVLETKREIAVFKNQIEQFKKEAEYIIEKKNFFGKEDEFILKRFNIFDRIREMRIDYLSGVKAWMRRMDTNLNIDFIKLPDIEEILNGPLFKYVSGMGSYQELFVAGNSVTSVFEDLRYRDNLTNSDAYKNNSEAKQFIDRVIKEEEKLIQDVEYRKDVLAKVANMQVESEGKLKKLEKQILDIAMIVNGGNIPGKYANETAYISWSTEMSLELAREYLQQILVRKAKVESMILKRIRDLYMEKLDLINKADFANGSENQDKKVVLSLSGENK